MLKPIAAAKWNFTTAAHLMNRAGFGGTPEEIETLIALGPEKAVARQFMNEPSHLRKICPAVV